MSKEQNSRQLLVATMLSLVVAACSHTTSPSAQINSSFAPFSSTRNQAVGMVANTKHSLGASDVNTLDVAYTALQEKANAYASFMVEAITTSSFDPAKNAKYAADLATAISNFDKGFSTLSATRQVSVANIWVPSFAQSLQTRWDQYSGYIAKMPPQTKADLIAAIKRDTVWPNYEDIGTEPVATNR
ncbi:MAG: hypothetical protein WBE79_05280 [Candidatus Cybelea sp.]